MSIGSLSQLEGTSHSGHFSPLVFNFFSATSPVKFPDPQKQGLCCRCTSYDWTPLCQLSFAFLNSCDFLYLFPSIAKRNFFDEGSDLCAEDE